MDAFSLESQRRAGRALQEGAFDQSLVAVHNPDGTLALDQEEYPRPQTTAEFSRTAARLRRPDGYAADSGRTYREMVAERWPGLVVDHRHHAGSSSGVVDGAGALVMAAPDYAQKNDLKPRARIVAMANMGHSPEYILNALLMRRKKYWAKRE